MMSRITVIDPEKAAISAAISDVIMMPLMLNTREEEEQQDKTSTC
jgi:hypothetical protein